MKLNELYNNFGSKKKIEKELDEALAAEKVKLAAEA